MKVFKFGGASVRDGEAVVNVMKILEQNRDDALVIVLSAMGKMTNAFELLARLHAADKRKESARQLEHIHQFHVDLMHSLFPDPSHEAYANLQQLIDEIKTLLANNVGTSFGEFYDSLIPFGELISTRIVSDYLTRKELKHLLIDARILIRTNSDWREASVDWDATQENIQRLVLPVLNSGHASPIVLTQGFIGSNESGRTTTLGDRKSDYTAAILAHCLNAAQVVIWKDVPGLLNADPKVLPNTTKLDEVPYGEAIELAYYGASIIHPKTIKPLENKKIPLYVRSFSSPELSGSVIGDVQRIKPLVPNYIYKFNQTLISLTPRDFSFITSEVLFDIFGVLSHHSVKLNLMQNSAISFSACFDGDKYDFDQLIGELKPRFKIRYNHHLLLITIRNYQLQGVEDLIREKQVLLEQRSRSTLQLLVPE